MGVPNSIIKRSIIQTEVQNFLIIKVLLKELNIMVHENVYEKFYTKYQFDKKSIKPKADIFILHMYRPINTASFN
jgi:hypothetical protein